MAHKTFISYKYSEAQNLRDKIIEALGDDATYYTGETSDSSDLSDTSTGNIRRVLSDMIYQTSVTIVIISPNMIHSKWIDWEIEYSLKEINRANRNSKTNGVVGVIMKVNGGYDWLTNHYRNCHDSPCINYKKDKLYPIIHQNQFNSNPPIQHCSLCKTFDFMNGSYITFIEEETFLQDPQKYIDNAYQKSQNIDNYCITKQK
ncbi:MAG: TIR domain-containing protein [Bacteroidales bacterium]|jgi:hypothetical protein|nr:TIR domain-containing protein [Bacteroidales bacterium]